MVLVAHPFKHEKVQGKIIDLRSFSTSLWISLTHGAVLCNHIRCTYSVSHVFYFHVDILPTCVHNIEVRCWSLQLLLLVFPFISLLLHLFWQSFNKFWENTDLARQKDRTLFQLRDHTLDANVSTSLSFPGVSDGKESACNVGDLGLTPGLGRFPGGGHATHSSIPAWRIPTDRGAW